MKKTLYVLSLLLAVIVVFAGCTKDDAGDTNVEKFTVTFDSKGGSVVESVGVAKDAKVTKPTDPTYDDFIFVGWFKEATYANAWDFDNDVVTANITLYAKWTTVQYTVTFNSKGGSAVESVDVAKDAKVTKPTDPTHDDFIFVGWFKESTYANAWDFDNDVVTANITLYAKWTTIQHTVTFETNGGRKIDPVKVPDGAIFKFPLPPSKEGEAFEEWCSDVELTKVYNFSTPVKADITLYAKWTGISRESLGELIRTSFYLRSYTTKSLNRYYDKWDAARDVYLGDQGQITPTQITNAYNELQAAIEGLELLPEREAVSIYTGQNEENGIIFIVPGHEFSIYPIAEDANGNYATDSEVTFHYDAAKLSTWVEGEIENSNRALIFKAKPNLFPGLTISVTVRSAFNPTISETYTLKVCRIDDVRELFLKKINELPDPSEISYEHIPNLRYIHYLYFHYIAMDSDEVLEAAYEKKERCEDVVKKLPKRYYFSFDGDECVLDNVDDRDYRLICYTYYSEYNYGGGFPCGEYYSGWEIWMITYRKYSLFLYPDGTFTQIERTSLYRDNYSSNVDYYHGTYTFTGSRTEGGMLYLKFD